MGAATHWMEGELSYHARVFEGGAAAFLQPSTAEIFLVDDGRIIETDSCYRNELGETFSELKTKRWENFFLEDKSGSQRVLENLRRHILHGDLPNMIIQQRQAK